MSFLPSALNLESFFSTFFLIFFACIDLLSTTTPKDPRASLGGPERWLGPLSVYCKVVAKSTQKIAKKDSKFSVEGKK